MFRIHGETVDHHLGVVHAPLMERVRKRSGGTHRKIAVRHDHDGTVTQRGAEFHRRIGGVRGVDDDPRRAELSLCRGQDPRELRLRRRAAQVVGTGDEIQAVEAVRADGDVTHAPLPREQVAEVIDHAILTAEVHIQRALGEVKVDEDDFLAPLCHGDGEPRGDGGLAATAATAGHKYLHRAHDDPPPTILFYYTDFTRACQSVGQEKTLSQPGNFRAFSTRNSAAGA